MKISEMSDDELCDLILESKGRPEQHTLELARRLKNPSIHVDVRTQRAWLVDRTDKNDRPRPRRRINDATFTGGQR
jgi:hypothetical protein